jgi:hypothetical protein
MKTSAMQKSGFEPPEGPHNGGKAGMSDPTNGGKTMMNDPNMNRQANETRAMYLMRVAIKHIRMHADDAVTFYDNANCDGHCLAQEMQHELDRLTEIVKANKLPDFWPLPWTNAKEQGNFGDIEAANWEPVGQIQQISPAFEQDIRKRPSLRNEVAAKICNVLNYFFDFS